MVQFRLSRRSIAFCRPAACRSTTFWYASLPHHSLSSHSLHFSRQFSRVCKRPSHLPRLFTNAIATHIHNSRQSVLRMSSTKATQADYESIHMSTDFDKEAEKYETPYLPQDPKQVEAIVNLLSKKSRQSKNKSKSRSKYKDFCRSSNYEVPTSPNKIVVTSYKMGEADYRTSKLPIYARGLFTTVRQDGKHEIVIRGYDKFFNHGEVPNTRWHNVVANTRGPYELSMKENGCIIFISGLEDGTLLVTSKHAVGPNSGMQGESHSEAGESRIEKQLAALGKTKEDLAMELRARNATAVAELCDDSFEEHILPYTGENAGLYLHGINLNLPKFHTYPSPLVQKFAADWGFKKIGIIMMDKIEDVKGFLEYCAETGAHSGRDIEGFVIRCQAKTTNAYLRSATRDAASDADDAKASKQATPETEASESSEPPAVEEALPDSPDSEQWHDWFFKYKFEEPYLMYRQWREVTKSMISGKVHLPKKHRAITEEYLEFAKKKLKSPEKRHEYLMNHGIIELRNQFLEYKKMGGQAASMMVDEDEEIEPNPNVTRNVVIAPVASIGCGKTTIAHALANLFGWGHIQNDNIVGKGRPAKFTTALSQDLKKHPVVIADRNSSLPEERKQLIKEVKEKVFTPTIICLHFIHPPDKLDEIRRITRERVKARGDNHQTIQAATDEKKFMVVLDGFIDRFKKVDPKLYHYDGKFDAVIDLDPTAGSRVNLEIIIKDLHARYPGLVPKMPSAKEMDKAFEQALQYKPEFRAPPKRRARNENHDGKTNNAHDKNVTKNTSSNILFFAIEMPAEAVSKALEHALIAGPKDAKNFYDQLQKNGRVQREFHVTLVHKNDTKESSSALFARYQDLQRGEMERTNSLVTTLGRCKVELERVIYNKDMLMAIAVKLHPAEEGEQWKSANEIPHITIGTKQESIKPRLSNDLLERWQREGVSDEVKMFELSDRPTIDGEVRVITGKPR